MAASDSASQASSSVDDGAESAAGMAHLTVVPTNFDPEDSSGRGAENPNGSSAKGPSGRGA